MKIITLFSVLLLSIPVSHADIAYPKLKVIATNSIIGDWVKEVANDHVDLTVFVGPDTDNHTFEPTPQEGVQLAKADIIIENGLGLEYWLNALYKSSESKALRVALNRDLKDLLTVNCHGHFKCSHAHDHEYDPHTWLSPDYVITMVQSITDVLVNKDPKNADFYKSRSRKYLEKLRELDAWIIEQVALIPPANRKLITNHDSFRYFARQYGFMQLGDILGSTSTDNVDPSAAQFATLVKVIHKNKVPAIFGETIQNPVLINNLAQAAKLPRPKLLYTEALSKEEGPAKNYIELMRYNVKTLVEGLK